MGARVPSLLYLLWCVDRFRIHRTIFFGLYPVRSPPFPTCDIKVLKSRSISSMRKWVLFRFWAYLPVLSNPTPIASAIPPNVWFTKFPRAAVVPLPAILFNPRKALGNSKRERFCQKEDFTLFSTCMDAVPSMSMTRFASLYGPATLSAP